MSASLSASPVEARHPAPHCEAPLKRLAAVVAMAAVACLTACAQPAPPPPAAAQPGVENESLVLRVASVPAPFTLATSDDDAIVFSVPETDGGGEIRIEAGPEETFGINLVDALKEREAAFLAMADGQFLGQLEIAGPYGPAFTARGTYSEDNGPVEESWIYAVHPGVDVNRLLTVAYRYPRGDAENSKTRVNQLLELFGEIEPLV